MRRSKYDRSRAVALGDLGPGRARPSPARRSYDELHARCRSVAERHRGPGGDLSLPHRLIAAGPL